MSAEITSQASSVAPHTRKRRRIQLACSTCRDHKIRCDGLRPICSSCIRKDVQATCSYESAPLQKQEYIEGLKSRIKYLEGIAGLGNGEIIGERHSPSRSTRDTKRYAGDADSEQESPSTFSSSLERQDPDFQSVIENPNSVGQEHSDYDIKRSADALGTTSSSHGAEALYGSSSTIAFVSSVNDAANLKHNLSGSSPGPTSYSVAKRTRSPNLLQGLEINRDEDQTAFVLPRRRTADNFLNCYWEFIHPLFPVVHKTSFESTYEAMWSPATQENQDHPHNDLDYITSYAQLNLMLALGCRFSTIVDPADRIVRANEFYQRSRRLLRFDILDSMHLPLVQVLLLTGIYLQSTKYANRCWNVVGLAIRVAHGFGLHLDSDTSSPEVQVETEMRRRIWHTCVMLDRLLAMTFGRPTMISRKTVVRLPSLIDDEYLLQDGLGTQPPSVSSHMGLFIFSLKLYDILDDILSAFYLHELGKLLPKQTNSRQKSTTLSDVLKFNSQLDNFYENLPAYLKISSTSSSSRRSADTGHISLQSNVLYCRFLYVRILLLRQVLLARTQDDFVRHHQSVATGATLEEEIVTRCCILCIKSSHLVIQQLSETLPTPYRSSAWHSVYFKFYFPLCGKRLTSILVTFAAAMVLVTAQLSDLEDASTDESSLDASWERCNTVLLHYQPEVPAASEALSALRTLRERAQRLSKPGSPLRPPQDQHNIRLQAAEQQVGQISHPSINNLAANNLDPNANNASFGQEEQSQEEILMGHDQALVDPIFPGDLSFDINQAIGSNDFSLSNDAWFTQNFIDSDWLEIARDQGGFFF